MVNMQTKFSVPYVMNNAPYLITYYKTIRLAIMLGNLHSVVSICWDRAITLADEFYKGVD